MAVEPGGGGKLRNKRNHGSKPYTRHNAENKSLFRRVTDTVASIILPTWMPNFMSWKTEDLMQDLNENHQEDLNLESTSSVHLTENNIVHATTSRSHPSSKLWPRASSRSDLTAPDGSYDSGAFSTQSVLSNEFPQWSENEPVRRSETSLSSECVPPSNIHLLSKEPVPDNRSECSDASVSTSGCSSMIPHPDRREYQKEILQLNDSSLRQLSEKLTRSCLPSTRPPLHVPGTNDSGYRNVKRTSSGPFQSTPDVNSVIESNTSLESHHLGGSSQMDESRNCIQHSKPQPSAVGKKPTFNVDAFENPVWNDRSILNESLISSPFYGGPTSFGGAAANRRNKYQSYLPYSAPSKSSKRAQVRVKNLNSTSDFDNLDGMSSTTRRILDTLEKMSTPLMDAKRIPSKSSFADSPFMINRTITRRPNLTGPDPHGSLPLRRGPPLNRLQTPIASSTGKQPRLEVPKAKSASENPKNDVPAFGWSSAASASSSFYSTSNKTSESRKMKTRQTMHYSSKPTAEENVEPPLELPQIPLPISTLPTFNFDLTKTPAVKPNDNKNAMTVNFRPPSEVGIKTFQKTSAKDNEDVEFVFSSPLKVVVSETKDAPKAATIMTPPTQNGNFTFGSISSASLLKQKPKSPEISVSATLSAAKELKEGSVMDFFKSSNSNFASDKPKTRSSKGKEDAKTKQLEGTWSCPKCSINNPDSKTNCASCDTTKPGHIFGGTKMGFGDKFKPKLGSWECTVCAVRNESISNKCISCETPKSGSSKTYTSGTQSAPLTSSSSFGNQYKMSSGSWECNTCLVRNKLDVSSCVACSSPRADSSRAPITSVTASTSSFGNQFKAAAGSWECDTCLVRNKSDVNTCVACNTPRLNSIQAPVTTAPAFKFGFASNLTTTIPSSSSTESTDFKFGVPSTSTPIVASTFKFGFSSSSSTPSTAVTTTTTTTSNIASKFVFGSGSGLTQTESKKAPINIFGGKKTIEAKDEIQVIEKVSDKKDEEDDDVTEIIEEKKEPTNKQSVFGMPVSSTPIMASSNRPLVFGSGKSEADSDKSWTSRPKTSELFNFLNPTGIEKSAEKHKHETDPEDEVKPKKQILSQDASTSFTSFLSPTPQTFIPLTTPTNTKASAFFKTPEPVSTPALTTTSKTSLNFGLKTPTTTIAVSTSSSEFLSPALPTTTTVASTAVPSTPIFGQITTTTPNPSFFTPPPTSGASAAMKMPTTSTVFGASMPSTPSSLFGGQRGTLYNSFSSNPDPLFGIPNITTMSTTSATAPSYGFMTTSAGSSLGTSTTNSIFSPTSSASVFPSLSTPATTSTTPSFFANTPKTAATKTTFSFGQPTTTAAVIAAVTVPQFGATNPTITGAAAGTGTGFGTADSTSSFTPLTTPNLFAFGNQSASIFGRPAAATQVSTPITTSFQGFGATSRPAASFQAPQQISGTSAPAFAPVAPTNRFAGSGAPAFQFGSNQQSPGIFTFTGSQEKTEPEPATTFQFNQPATTQSGFQFNAGNAPSFNFGAATASPIPTIPTIPSFGNSGPQSNPFEIPTTTAPTTNNPSRMIRRARRRK